MAGRLKSANAARLRLGVHSTAAVLGRHSFPSAPIKASRYVLRELKGPYYFVSRRHVSMIGGFQGPGSPAPQPGQEEEPGSKKGKQEKDDWQSTRWKIFESAATTFASIFVLGLAGFSYHKYYKHLILQKMRIAFEPGDPVLEIAALDGQQPNNIAEKGDRAWIPRVEQDIIDAIVNGSERGHYFLISGEKGTGKSSMVLSAMSKVDGEGVAVVEAHADLEIFRIRLGKALNYEFHEDYIGSLFSIKGPRDTTALLDIERAFNKLEKIALERRRKVGRPLIFVVNSAHLVRNDEDGRDLLELIQQRAEQWAAANLVTVVFNTDDYWVYERLKQLATRLEVLPIFDLPKREALEALSRYRQRYFAADGKPSTQLLERVYAKVGGRLNFLSRVAREEDMLAECDKIMERERTWFLNQCWILGSEMDDDVMDQQKFCSAAMVLAKALVDREKAEIAAEAAAGEPTTNLLDRPLPQIPLHEARQIMTRADFIEQYDHINIFTIDSRAMVRADSVPMMNAFREICSRPGFDQHLEDTLQRIADIESLGRTREVVAKDLVHGGTYKISDGKGREIGVKLEVAEEGQEK